MTRWQEIISALVRYPISREFEHLKPAFLAQWILECGRGSTSIFQKKWNPAGMKWREEMATHASKYWYATASEPPRTNPLGDVERGDYFCAFDGPLEAVSGYIRFLERSPYRGWKDHVSTPRAFLQFIGPIWCPAGYSDKWVSSHGGKHYHGYIMDNLFPEAVRLLKEAGWQSSTPSPPPKPKLNFAILLDAGHSESRRGAGGLPPDFPDEWEHNVLACNTMLPILRAAGANVVFEDPDPDNLVRMGQRARDFYLAYYNHHNAFDKDGVDEGTGVYIHPEASALAKRFAAFASKRIAAELGTRDRGVTFARFTVLEEAHKVGCPVAILPEFYFIDDYGNELVTRDRTTRAAKALAQATIDFFGEQVVDAPDTPKPPDAPWPMIRRGDKGEAVKRAQKELNEHGATLTVDGDFGPLTDAATRDFQSRKGLVVDGIIGPNTWRELLKAPDEPVPPGSKRERLAAVAKKHALADYKESDGSFNYFRRDFFGVLGSKNWPWCGAFVFTCVEEAFGRQLPIKPGGAKYTYALVEQWQMWAIAKGYWHDAPGFDAKPGDIAVFDWHGAKYPDNDWEDHIGVLLYREGNAFVCGEGNVEDATRIRKRYLKNIQGFIRLPDNFEV